MAQRYRFPKVELHCHLDGCFRVSTILELAKKRGIPLPTYDKDKLKEHITVTSRCASLKNFLEPFNLFGPTFAGDADAITRITREAIEDRSEDGVVYLELRYSPHLLANCDVEPMTFAKERGRLRPKDVVELVNKAVKESADKLNIRVRTILCNIAEFPGWGMQTAKLCQEFTNQGVVGTDIADIEGEENHFSECIQAFEYCRMNGIHRTVHAGEAGDATQVETAIERLYAERIGHGYHVVDDVAIYEIAKQRGTHFEVCPTSSYRTSSVSKNLSQHPAKMFFDDNVNFSLSTDDPGLLQNTLVHEYDFASEHWGMKTKDLQQLNINAAKSCFLNGAERQELIQHLEKSYRELNISSM